MLTVSVVAHNDDWKMFSAPESYSERASFPTPKGTGGMTQCARVLAAWHPQKKLPGLPRTEDGDRRIVGACWPLAKLRG